MINPRRYIVMVILLGALGGFIGVHLDRVDSMINQHYVNTHSCIREGESHSRTYLIFGMHRQTGGFVRYSCLNPYTVVIVDK